jgi:hypothetical protein
MQIGKHCYVDLTLEREHSRKIWGDKFGVYSRTAVGSVVTFEIRIDRIRCSKILNPVGTVGRSLRRNKVTSTMKNLNTAESVLYLPSKLTKPGSTELIPRVTLYPVVVYESPKEKLVMYSTGNELPSHLIC